MYFRFTMNKHLIHINILLEDASQHDDPAVEVLAEEVRRLRRVVAQLAPFMVQAAEEVIDYAHELEESGVDPCEPALAGLNDTINRLRVAFRA